MSDLIQLKKIIAFDLDGTLAESKQSMTEEMAKLLISLAKVAKVVIISGGSIYQFKKQFVPALLEIEHDSMDLVQASLNLKNIILLPTSGSVQFEYDIEKKEWVEKFAHPFSEELQVQVMNLLTEIISHRREEFEIPETHFGEYIENRGTQITFSGLGQDAPSGEKSLWDPTASKRKKIADLLEETIPQIHAHIGGMTSIDILPRGFDKAEGLKVLLARLGLPLTDMLFVGDAVFEGGNDYSPKVAGIETVGIKNPAETAFLISALLQTDNSG